MGEGRLAGKAAIVTGASRGIGRAVAEGYAAAGADLFLTATGLAQLEEVRAAAEAAGARVELFAGDVSDRAVVEDLFAAAVAAYPALNVVVNNAGIYRGAPFLDYAPEDFDRVMQVNTYGVFHMMQLAGRQFRERGGGKIVNIASTAGKWASPHQAAYNASKHAVVGLTRCAALDLAPDNINVNAICPGMVETDMVGDFKPTADRLGMTMAEMRESIRSTIPLGRFLDPSEIAHLAVYLASTESDGMTGQTITISCGMRMG